MAVQPPLAPGLPAHRFRGFDQGPQEGWRANGSLRQVRLGGRHEAAGPTGRGRAPGLHSGEKGL